MPIKTIKQKQQFHIPYSLKCAIKMTFLGVTLTSYCFHHLDRKLEAVSAKENSSSFGERAAQVT
ncbi:hypothetical protein VIBC2010_16379 [Vibrio caribbeanicus ATCC BAA-2122]|uniref:Uncharacterized protein n=1 Tax=Vibrio caribbeanicus ATCC BAA-2122 TaxID=796620 RepID=E3BQN3_9VIBR|nr:hypothetical protein VIBC2010_16379 [Vibrio caribbeanicus ATCC BAA-2122]